MFAAHAGRRTGSPWYSRPVRPGAVLLALILVALAAFGAGMCAVTDHDRDAPPPPATGGDPVLALDPSSVSLRPDADLAVDWGALTPPVAPLPSPGQPPLSPPAPRGSSH